jgi:phospholipid/cholesterol/gamma-HCH transport system substrate-binding protein
MRPKRRSQHPRRATLIAALTGILVLAALSYSALTAGNGLPLFPYYYVNAQFGDAAELDPHSDVRIAGVLVGQVLSTSIQHGVAVARLQLNRSAGRLRSDTTARIRLRGPLGAKLVELSPGRDGKPMPSGSTIPATQTSTSVAVFDVIAMFDARRRADLRALLGGLGEGFLGRGAQLNEALTNSPAVVSDLGQVADAVNSRQGAAQRFVPSSASLSAAFDPVRDELAAGFDPAARALAPFTDERPSVQDMLSIGAGALDSIRQGLAQTDPLLVQTAGFSRAAVRLTAPAPAALQAAAVLLAQARGPLLKARALVETLAGAAPPTLMMLQALAPLAAPIGRSLANSTPGLDTLGRYGCDVEGWARNYYAGFKLGTPPNTLIGPTGIARAAVANNQSASNGNAPGKIAHDAYPAPCTAASEHTP